MTLSMDGLGYPDGGESAALLSPCHNQISLPVAAFCGKAGLAADAVAAGCGRISFHVLDLF